MISDVIVSIVAVNLTLALMVAGLTVYVRLYRWRARQKLLRASQLPDATRLRRQVKRLLASRRSEASIIDAIGVIERATDDLSDRINELARRHSPTTVAGRIKCLSVIGDLRFPVIILRSGEAADLRTPYDSQSVFELWLKRELVVAYSVKTACKVVREASSMDVSLEVRRFSKAAGLGMSLVVFKYLMRTAPSPAREVAGKLVAEVKKAKVLRFIGAA